MNKSPVFPVASEGNYLASDYGFDPQIDYFQVLEEARRHTQLVDPRPLNSLHCKLQKPVTKDDAKTKKRRRWWRWTSALLFWRRPKVASDADERKNRGHWQKHPGAVSGPIYATDSCVRGGRRTTQPSSGPLRAAEVGAEAAGWAYLSLRNLSALEGNRTSTYTASPAAKPIYLVT